MTDVARASLGFCLGTGLGAALAIGCHSDITEHDDPTARRRTVVIHPSVVAEVDERFLSVAVDSAQLVGGTWWSPDGRVEGVTGDHPQPVFDFARPRLRRLAAELAPAFLRLGGSEADKVFYALSGDAEDEDAPEGFERVMTRAQWDGAADFAKALGFDLFFTLNAGPGPRDDQGAWQPDNARVLLEHAARRRDPVGVWELGNEVNAFQIIHGFSFRVSASQYAEDLRMARRLVKALQPGSLLAGPSSAYWPEIGEVPELYAPFMALGGDLLDVITWHYYPQQSRRCGLRVTPADESLMHAPNALDEVGRWADHVERVRDEWTPDTSVWMGETGNAQCGGEPGLSDGYKGGFWWLDQLGHLARRGQPVVIRQSLTGASYGLLREPDLEPRPDYWSSVLFKRLMGRRVLVAEVLDDRSLRAYAHCFPGRTGALSLLFVNIHRTRGAFAHLEGVIAERAQAFRLTGAEDDAGIALNDVVLRAGPDGRAPPLVGVEERLDRDTPEVWIPARSYAFFVLQDAQHQGCP